VQAEARKVGICQPGGRICSIIVLDRKDCLTKVGGMVWLDANNNGVQDPGEAGIPNVQIHICCPDDHWLMPLPAPSVSNHEQILCPARVETPPKGNFFIRETQCAATLTELAVSSSPNTSSWSFFSPIGSPMAGVSWWNSSS